MKVIYVASLLGVLIGLFMDWFSLAFWSWSGLHHWTGSLIGVTTAITLTVFLIIPRQTSIRFLTILIPSFVILQWIMMSPWFPGNEGGNLNTALGMTKGGFYFTLLSALIAVASYIRYTKK